MNLKYLNYNEWTFILKFLGWFKFERLKICENGKHFKLKYIKFVPIKVENIKKIKLNDRNKYK